jgi:hypothetical protein
VGGGAGQDIEGDLDEEIEVVSVGLFGYGPGDDDDRHADFV